MFAFDPKRYLHDTSATFTPLQVTSGSLLGLCICLPDTSTKYHTEASHTGASSPRLLYQSKIFITVRKLIPMSCKGGTSVLSSMKSLSFILVPRAYELLVTTRSTTTKKKKRWGSRDENGSPWPGTGCACVVIDIQPKMASQSQICLFKHTSAGVKCPFMETQYEIPMSYRYEISHRFEFSHVNNPYVLIGLRSTWPSTTGMNYVLSIRFI